MRGNTATILGSPAHIPPAAVVKVGQIFAIGGFTSGTKAINSDLKRVEVRLARLTGAVAADMPQLGGSMLMSFSLPADGFGADVRRSFWSLG